MAQPYDPATHPTTRWTWRDDPTWGAGNGYWQLNGSEGTPGPVGPHNFECCQYALAKINGRRPHHGDSTEFADLIAELTRLQFHQHECGACGCGAGLCPECVVIYYRGSDPFHVAVFDRQLCDWGGKATAMQPIVRFKNPGDYKKATETLVCWCRETPGRYIEDERINDGALTPEEVAGEEADRAWLVWLIRILRGVYGWFRRWWPF